MHRLRTRSKKTSQSPKRAAGMPECNLDRREATGSEQVHQIAENLVSDRRRNVLKHEKRTNEVKLSGGQIGEVFKTHESNVAHPGTLRVLPSMCQHRRRNVAGHHPQRTARHGQCQTACATAEVERARQVKIAPEQ